jgi:hypothetical protein
MKVVVDLSHIKPGVNASFFFSGEFLAVLSEFYPEYEFVFITNEINSLIFSPQNTFSKVLFNSSVNPLRQYLQQKALQKKIEELRPDIYIGAPGSIFSGMKKFCLLISTAEELKQARKKGSNSKTVFCTDDFSFYQLQQQPLANSSKLFYAPPVPLPVYQKMGWEERERIKNEVSDGCEYFLLLNPVLQEAEFVNLLKAFSFFKKRLQSSIKLMIAARREEFAAPLLQLLATYKYGSDVLFTGDLSNSNHRASLVAACYAALQVEVPFKTFISLQDALACAVPVVLCSHSAISSYENIIIQTGTAPEDIARILMLLYKDEQYRKRVIENGKQGLQHFSHTVNAALLTQCIDDTAGEISSFS